MSLTSHFLSSENIKLLTDVLTARYASNKQLTERQIKTVLADIAELDKYAANYSEQLYMMNPVLSTQYATKDALIRLNKEFLRDRIDFIQKYTLGCNDSETYNWSDGLVASSYTQACMPMQTSADQDLESWKSKCARGAVFRDDRIGDASYYTRSKQIDMNAQRAAQKNEAYSVGTSSASLSYNYKDTVDPELQRITGDQDNLCSSSQHINSFMNDPAFVAMNSPVIYKGDHVFGTWDDASNKRLLSRRIFRTENGIENGIPLWRQKIQVRNVDRSKEYADETLGGFEMDYRGDKGLSGAQKRLIERRAAEGSTIFSFKC